jgi:uncharacterized protein
LKALVLSDTHIKSKEELASLRKSMEPYLNDVDVIFHAGDTASMIAVDFFKELKPVYMVAGNMDDAQSSFYLPEKLVVDFGGFRIGLTHGWGKVFGIEDRVFEYFSSSNVDAIIFGHSHQSFVGRKEGVLLLNPGSPTDKRFAEFNSMAILEVGEELEARIIRL